jgi:hypothetical protein
MVSDGRTCRRSPSFRRVTARRSRERAKADRRRRRRARRPPGGRGDSTSTRTEHEHTTGCSRSTIGPAVRFPVDVWDPPQMRSMSPAHRTRPAQPKPALCVARGAATRLDGPSLAETEGRSRSPARNGGSPRRMPVQHARHRPPWARTCAYRASRAAASTSRSLALQRAGRMQRSIAPRSLATVTGEIGLTCWRQVNQRSTSAATVRVRLPRCPPRSTCSSSSASTVLAGRSAALACPGPWRLTSACGR